MELPPVRFGTLPTGVAWAVLFKTQIRRDLATGVSHSERVGRQVGKGCRGARLTECLRIARWEQRPFS